MTLDLGDGRNVCVHSHSGKVWLTSYNGCGTANELTAEQAMEIGLAVWQEGRRLKRGASQSNALSR